MTEHSFEAEVAEIDDHDVRFYHNEAEAEGVVARLLASLLRRTPRKLFSVPFSENPGIDVGETVEFQMQPKGGR